MAKTATPPFRMIIIATLGVDYFFHLLMPHTLLIPKGSRGGAERKAVAAPYLVDPKGIRGRG